MIKVEKIREGIWTFPIVLPDNPLKWLNCYVIKGENGGRNLLIDTGFNRPECLYDLLEGMDVLGICAEDTDVFFTHMHADHTGNGKVLQDLGARLFIGRTDYNTRSMNIEHSWEKIEQRVVREGMDHQLMENVIFRNPNTIGNSQAFDAQLLDEGDELWYGGRRLRCVSTPGHTPGHMCLYEPNEKIMFLGDHVLFDVTPNITMWPEMEDSLGTYLENLKKLKAYDVKLALPGHRHIGTISMQERIDILIEHHMKRLEESLRIIREEPECNAFQIAGKLTWQIRARNWEEFPDTQKWFAFGETLAHLDYLVKRKIILKKQDEVSGNIVYLPKI